MSLVRFTCISRQSLSRAAVGVSQAVKNHPSSVVCYRASTSSASASTEDGSTLQQQAAPVKPFSELPGEGSESFVRRLIYGLKGWRTKSEAHKPWGKYKEWDMRYGPVYKRVFGNTVQVYLTDPEDFALVCKNEGKYPRRANEHYDLLASWKLYKQKKGRPYGLFLENGEDWNRHRRPMNKKIMRPHEILKYSDNVNDVITDFMHRIRHDRLADNTVPDFQMLCSEWSAESVASVLFNKRVHLLAGNASKETRDYVSGVYDVFETSPVLFKLPANVQAALMTEPWKRFARGWDAISEYGKNRVDEKFAELKELKEKGEVPDEVDTDIMTYLLLHSDLSIDEVYSSVTELLIASVDTTGNALQWIAYYLARHPEWQDRLLQEIRRVVPRGETASREHVNHLPLVSAVINEALRLRPVIANATRILENDVVIKGYNIPAETPITFLFYQSGRNPKYYEDPLEFKPERWLDRKPDKLNAFLALPFGFGARMCIGKRVAMLELHLVLSRICQQFFLESSAEVDPMLSFVVTPDKPLNPKFVDRDDTSDPRV